VATPSSALSYAAATVPDVGPDGPRLPGEWLRIRGAGSVGWASDEAAVILAGPDAGELCAAARGVGGGDVRPLEPTARPTGDPPAVTPGVVALRWFDLSAADWDEFLDLSVGAWPAFEASFDATVLGLFRAGGVGPPDAAALLVTRYASLAVWEESRSVLAARSGSLAHSGRRFLRRHELTRRSIVRIGRLA
jgi:hypothetical protein